MARPRRGTTLLALCVLGLAACGGTNRLPTDQEDAGTPTQDDAGDPNQPPAGFLNPTGPSWLTLRFKGVINSYETVADDYSNIITGIGSLKATFQERTLELSDSDGMYAYDYTYPDQSRYVVATGSRATADSTSSKGSMQEANLYFPTDAALALDAGSHLLGGKIAVSLRDADYVVRKDTSVLYKLCYQGMADAGAQVFLDHSANQSYGPGENLILWANIPVVTDRPTLIERCGSTCTLYQGAPCRCYVDNADLDCALWDDEVAKDGTQLSCGPPADFLTPPATGDWATFKFKGPIATADDPSPPAGYAVATVSVGGTVATASMFGYATEYDPGTDSNLLDVAFYDEQSGAGGIVTLTELDFYVTPAALVAAKGRGTNPLVMDAATPAVGLAQKLTAYPSGGDYLYRVCPYAVFRAGETTGSVYDCPAGNTTFGAGERLEIEGNLVLQTNVTADDVGVPLEADGCYCSNGTALVACSTLPQS
jgi:hypothetical protein